MSCTVMYQPYAMSYSSSCDRTTNENKKSFKFPHAPSPPESSHSNASSSYSSPGSTGGVAHNALLGSLSLLPPHLQSPSGVGAASSHGNNGAGSSTGTGQRRPLTPGMGGSATSGSASASATITSASQLSQHHHHSHHSHSHGHHSSHHQHHQSSSGSQQVSHRGSSSFPLSHSSLNLSSSATATSRDLSHGPSSSSSSAASSSSHHAGISSAAGGAGRQQAEGSDDESTGRGDTQQGSQNEGDGAPGGSNGRAQYLSANCIVYVNYDGNAARVVDEHFQRAMNGPYSEKSSKSLPMSSRNFPPSFWNSNYQPSKPSLAYGAADFYGTAMDYSASIPGFAHHHAQADPWHYPLGTHHHHHQSYHRPSDITYPPMSSTSRFNAAQYGSFLFPSTSAAAAAARFPGIPTPGQCSVKGDAAHHWAGGRYDGWSDLHLAADYSAAAAAHYSNMTAAAGKGLDFETHYLQSS